MAEKRSSETGQSVAQIGFCLSCNRTSNSLDKCDKCGNLLPKESASWAYSSDPKRVRKDNLSNGTSSPIPNASPVSQQLPSTTSVTVQNNTTGVTNGSVNGMSSPIASAVPQALFLNTTNINPPAVSTPQPNSTVTSSNSLLPPLSLPATISTVNQVVRPQPQALYVNINNNQMYSNGVNSSPSPGVVTSMNNLLTSSAISSAPQLLNSSHPQLSNSLNTHSLTATNNIPLPRLPNLQSRQPMPTVQTSIVSGNVRPNLSLPQSSPAVTPASGLQSPATQPPQSKILIQVQQIRIGLKGFLPASGVQFKEDGVLFTLRDYQSAPLLLNIRAILKCRANLKAPFPALFFYLEASCIKQIRQIFYMRDSDFDEKSPYDRVKCVALFPQNITANEARMIADIFQLMKKSANRPSPLLETISPEEVLDILYGTSSNLNMNTNDPNAASQRNGVISNNPATHNAMPPAYPNQQGGVPTASQTLQQTVMNSRVRPHPSPNAINTQQTVRQQLASNPPPLVPSAMNNPAHNRNSVSPPTLVIPPDNAQWQQMKRTLVKNGIYRVEMGAQKKYCTWNGTQLHPCHVPEIEVEAVCERVRIGSLIGPAASTLRVDNGKQQMSFSYKHSSGSNIDIVIPFSQTVRCSLSPCLASLKLISFFIYVTDSYASRIRSICGMTNDGKKEPFFHPSSTRDKHKYLVLFLKEMPPDRKDILMNMKVMQGSGVHRPLATDIDIMGALKLCSDIEADSKGVKTQSRIEDFFGPNGSLSGSNADEKSRELLKEVAGIDITPPVMDDDDDDVVMTNEEVGIKCPYTQQIMKEPIRNKHCGHNYEKAAIIEFINRKRTKNIEPRCPYAGCGNKTALAMDDLEDNHELKLYIANSQSNPS